MKQFFGAIKYGFIKIGDAMGWVMTRVLLTVMYFTVLALIWLIARLFGKRFMDLSFKSEKKSYWIESEPDFNTHTLEKWEMPF